MSHLAQAMREGKIYANVHSTEYPAGLIREQVEKMYGHSYAMVMTDDMEDADEEDVVPVDEEDTDEDMDEDVDSDDHDATPVVSGMGAHLTLSDYYILPPTTVTLHGHEFMSGEMVMVTAGAWSVSVLADQYGDLEIVHPSVPLSAAGSMVEIHATGLTSGLMRMTTLEIGTYYPVVTPSMWYVDGGDTITFDGMYFGPSEDVWVSLDGVNLATAEATSMGSMTHTIAAPTEPGMYTYWFTGLESGAEHMVTVHVN